MSTPARITAVKTSGGDLAPIKVARREFPAFELDIAPCVDDDP